MKDHDIACDALTFHPAADHERIDERRQPSADAAERREVFRRHDRDKVASPRELSREVLIRLQDGRLLIPRRLQDDGDLPGDQGMGRWANSIGHELPGVPLDLFV